MTCTCALLEETETFISDRLCSEWRDDSRRYPYGKYGRSGPAWPPRALRPPRARAEEAMSSEFTVVLQSSLDAVQFVFCNGSATQEADETLSDIVLNAVSFMFGFKWFRMAS